MKKEMGVGRCGAACCLCKDNDTCKGCDKDIKNHMACENLRCSREKNITGCYNCDIDCQNGMMGEKTAAAFSTFIRRYGVETLIECLERNEKQGVLYHRDGYKGDYDVPETQEGVVDFIMTGKLPE